MVAPQDALFHQVQKPSPWISRGLLFNFILLVGLLFQFREEAGSRLWLLLPLGLAALWLQSLRLEVILQREGLWVRMAPFSGRLIPLHQIRGWRTQDFLPRSGSRVRGWAVRKGAKATIYPAGSVQEGIAIGLPDGKGVWVSTRRGRELASALSQAIPKHSEGGNAPNF